MYAGFAWLDAAWRLASAGARVAVLEARDQIGGRAHTLHPHDWPTPVELGAEFMGALLVCAYESEENCRQNNLDGSISLETFKSRLTSIRKDQELIFY